MHLTALMLLNWNQHTLQPTPAPQNHTDEIVKSHSQTIYLHPRYAPNSTAQSPSFQSLANYFCMRLGRIYLYCITRTYCIHTYVYIHANGREEIKLKLRHLHICRCGASARSSRSSFPLQHTTWYWPESAKLVFSYEEENSYIVAERVPPGAHEWLASNLNNYAMSAVRNVSNASR